MWICSTALEKSHSLSSHIISTFRLFVLSFFPFLVIHQVFCRLNLKTIREEMLTSLTTPFYNGWNYITRKWQLFKVPKTCFDVTWKLFTLLKSPKKSLKRVIIVLNSISKFCQILFCKRRQDLFDRNQLSFTNFILSDIIK